MCVGGGAPSIPPPPPPPPAPEPPPEKTDPEITRNRQRNRARAALAQNRQSTILTSGLGLTSEASTAPKQVLGV